MLYIRRRKKFAIPAVLLMLAALYLIWSISGRQAYTGPVQLNLKQMLEFGRDDGTGNVLAIQPWMLGEDYSSKRAFRAKLDGYFREAKRRNWLRSNTVVVLPEYFGAWLLCAGEKRNVWNAPTVSEAMKTKILSNAPTTAYAALTAPCSEKLRYAVFKTSASKMASIYDETLSGLARKYRVTIVGGSTILPSPSVVDGKLRAGSGSLFNVSPVYGPDGKAHSSLVTKVFLTNEEQSFLSPGNVTKLPVFDTPAGKMGVLICADSWFPRSYETLRQKSAELVVVPSFITGDRALDNKWDGYSGFPPPTDVHKPDIGTITKSEAWRRYALLGRLPRSGISYGVMSCLRGRLWDLGSDSCISVVHNTRPTMTHSSDGAAMVNVWLGE